MGGALIAEIIPGLTPGTLVHLMVDGLDVDLSGSIGHIDHDATLLRFELSDQAQKALEVLLLTKKAA